MPASEDKPDAEWDERVASTNDHELLRCTRGDQTRTYYLRVVPDGAELWRVTEAPGEQNRSVKESSFRTANEAARFLDEVRRTLTAGGWQE